MALDIAALYAAIGEQVFRSLKATDFRLVDGVFTFKVARPCSRVHADSIRVSSLQMGDYNVEFLQQRYEDGLVNPKLVCVHSKRSLSVSELRSAIFSMVVP